MNLIVDVEVINPAAQMSTAWHVCSEWRNRNGSTDVVHIVLQLMKAPVASVTVARFTSIISLQLLHLLWLAGYARRRALIAGFYAWGSELVLMHGWSTCCLHTGLLDGSSLMMSVVFCAGCRSGGPAAVARCRATSVA